MKKTILIVSALMLLAAGCKARRGSSATYTQKAYILNSPCMVRVYGPDEKTAKPLADAIFAEWNRIADEYNHNDPYSMTAIVNKKALAEWVPVNDEFLRLLQLSLDYYKLTGGAFDITFAPLWPLWKEAASTRKLPAKEDIQKALQGIGSNYIEVDAVKKTVHFTRPVQISLGGMLRAYCFERAFKLLKEKAPPYPVQLRLGGNTLVYGDRQWQYRVPDPQSKTKIFGRFLFRGGVVMSTAGQDSFVEIDGKIYPHILDLRTGYPIENFGSLTVYYPDIESVDFLSSTALTVLGKDKTFELLGKMPGTAALWVDAQGNKSFLLTKVSKAKWEEEKGTLAGLLEN